MSRSYRKSRICKDYMQAPGRAKFWKRVSNKKMRKMELCNGSVYKKIDIHGIYMITLVMYMIYH